MCERSGITRQEILAREDIEAGRVEKEEVKGEQARDGVGGD
jgi:hypothetical protein